MLGHAEEWLYRGLAGIDFDLSRPETEQIRLRPAIASGATDASATFSTGLGTISSSWHRNGNDWSAEFVIPAGARATLILPIGAASHEVFDHGRPDQDDPSTGTSNHTEKWLLGSGTYSFHGHL